MVRTLILALALITPSTAADYRSIGPWFVSTDSTPDGPVPVVGQTGPEFGVALRCEQGVPGIVLWGVGSRLDLRFGRPVTLRMMVDEAVVYNLRGAATQLNRAEFRQGAGPAITALRRGGVVRATFIDTDGHEREQTMTLAMADRAFRVFSTQCP